MPARANIAMSMVMKVIGIFVARPPISLSFLEPVVYIRAPAPMNSVVLNMAWLRAWYRPPATPTDVPIPIPIMTYPSWLTLEYARSFFMSS